MSQTKGRYDTEKSNENGKVAAMPEQKPPVTFRKGKALGLIPGSAFFLRQLPGNHGAVFPICPLLTQVAGAIRCSRREKRKQERGMRER